MTISQTANLLAEKHIIRSAFIYKIYALIFDSQSGVKQGDYLFSSPQSVLKVAYRTTHGIQEIPIIKVTVLAGSTVNDIAGSLFKEMNQFNVAKFLALAKAHEGYLYPDTYQFFSNVHADEVVKTMMDNFTKKITPFIGQIKSFSSSTDDVIKMASIIEKEANNSVDRRIIAGILWKRIKVKMALSVDPPFAYFLGKSSAELTLKDLATDSPYNLYKHLGLPPTPIDSPDIQTIEDTINPTVTPYYYYLSGKDGKMHYASTLEGHLMNKAKYLD